MAFVASLFIFGCARDKFPGGLTRLHAEGTRIVNEQGKWVVLKGVNLGGWLFNETWITKIDYSLHGRIHVLGLENGIGAEVDAALIETGPSYEKTLETNPVDPDSWSYRFAAALADRVGRPPAGNFISSAAIYPSISDDSDLPLRKLLEQRFGAETRDELLDIFQRAWIRETDIAWLAAQGFNVVRVPIGYRNLITESDLEPLQALTWNERAFAQIDALLEWCEKYEIYAVLDLQESPGGHNDYSGPALLYEKPEMQALTVDLWEEISSRYSDRDIVAAYSLLAEPMSAPSLQARDEMYDKIVQAIRARGDDHLLIIHDGFFGMDSLPLPGDYNWQNVIYSTHLFEEANNLEAYKSLVFLYQMIFKKAQSAQVVPYYIGSFSTKEDTDWAYDAVSLFLKFFNESGWSWSLWTYKHFDDPIDHELWGTSTSWGVRGKLSSSFDRPDVYRDDLQTLRKKFAAYADLVVDPNEQLLSRLKRGLQ